MKKNRGEIDMKYKRIWMDIVWVLLGSILSVLGMMGKVEEFWNGLGTSLAIMGTIQLFRFYRLYKDDVYREKIEIAALDERNCFIRNKAWAWSGYLFILIASAFVIILKLMKYDLASMVVSGTVIVMLLLYYGSYFILNKKY